MGFGRFLLGAVLFRRAVSVANLDSPRAMSSRRLELGTRNLGLTDDRGQRPAAKLLVVGNRDSDRGVFEALLHHDMAASTSDLAEAVTLEDRANLTA